MASESLPEVVPPVEAEEFVGQEVLTVAEDYVRLRAEAAKLDEQSEELKTKIKAREAWLLEQMAAHGTSKLTVCGKTLFQTKDLIVSKGTGVQTEQLIELLRSHGLGDLVSDSYSAGTLKARVKEYIAAAVESGVVGPGWYCPDCETIVERPDGELQRMCSCGASAPMLPVSNGIPKALAEALFVQPLVKMGFRSA